MSRQDKDLHRRVEAFLYLEARLMDESRYQEWLDLFDSECSYWIPSNQEDTDPSRHVSIMYCDRKMLENHVQRLIDGKSFAQSPPSLMRRLISNIEAFEENNAVCAQASFLLTELRGHTQTMMAGRSEYQFRDSESGLLIHRKKVVLLGIDEPQNNVTFLL